MTISGMQLHTDGDVLKKATVLALILSVVAVTLCCSKTKSESEEEKRDPVIVLDDWWNVDYIKSGCEMFAQQGDPASLCPVNLSPKEIVSQFDNDLKVAFGSESSCHGLSLLTFSEDMATAAVKNPKAPATGKEKVMAEAAHWSLMFDFDGRHENQNGSGWSLVNPSRHTFNGQIHSTQSLAQDVCKLVKGVGGNTD